MSPTDDAVRFLTLNPRGMHVLCKLACHPEGVKRRELISLLGRRNGDARHILKALCKNNLVENGCGEANPKNAYTITEKGREVLVLLVERGHYSAPSPLQKHLDMAPS